MNKEIETIEGVKGEWRTVTKPNEVTVGQRVRYTDCYSFHEYDSRFIYEISDKVKTFDGKRKNIRTQNMFAWTHVQAFFPLPVRAEKRKVAKVKVIQLGVSERHCFVTYPLGVYCGKTYATKKRAIRGAQRFCKAIGYECEIVKEGK